jgi:hypothetical protein
MTQRHFIELAAMLNLQRVDALLMVHSDGTAEVDRVRAITLEIALICKRDNPRFKAGKFFEAAGFPELTGTRQGLD